MISKYLGFLNSIKSNFVFIKATIFIIVLLSLSFTQASSNIKNKSLNQNLNNQLPIDFYNFSDEEKANFLANILSKQIRHRAVQLDQEIMLFRYETKSNFVPQNITEVKNRLSERPANFYNMNITTTDAAGPGSYYAIDPVASRSFGGDKPYLYVMTLKKDARLINLSTPLNPLEFNLLKDIHFQLNCKINISENLQITIKESEVSFFSLRKSSTSICRNVAIKTLAKLNIQAIFYGYLAANNLNDCRNRQEAVNVIDANAFNFKKMYFFSDDILLKTSNEDSFIKNIYQEANSDFVINFMNLNDYKMPASMEPLLEASANKYNSWKKENIYACGARSSIEKNISTNPLENSLNLVFNTYFRDFEIQSKLVELKKYFIQKTNNKFGFTFADILAITKLRFQGTGLPQTQATFEQWLYLQKNFYAENKADQNKQDLKKMYGIKIILDDIIKGYQDFETAFFKIPTLDRKKPDIYLKILNVLGLSGGYATDQLNSSVIDKGGIIISVSNPEIPFLKKIKISRNNYLKVLNECLALYQNQDISFEDIQKTECAYITK